MTSACESPSTTSHHFVVLFLAVLWHLYDKLTHANENINRPCEFNWSAVCESRSPMVALRDGEGGLHFLKLGNLGF